MNAADRNSRAHSHAHANTVHSYCVLPSLNKAIERVNRKKLQGVIVQPHIRKQTKTEKVNELAYL